MRSATFTDKHTFFFCYAKNAENISFTGTKPTYYYCIVLLFFVQFFQGDLRFNQFTGLLMMFRGVLISEGDVWLAKTSTAHKGPSVASVCRHY